VVFEGGLAKSAGARGAAGQAGGGRAEEFGGDAPAFGGVGGCRERFERGDGGQAGAGGGELEGIVGEAGDCREMGPDRGVCGEEGEVNGGNAGRGHEGGEIGAELEVEVEELGVAGGEGGEGRGAAGAGGWESGGHGGSVRVVDGISRRFDRILIGLMEVIEGAGVEGKDGIGKGVGRGVLAAEAATLPGGRVRRDETLFAFGGLVVEAEEFGEARRTGQSSGGFCSWLCWSRQVPGRSGQGSDRRRVGVRRKGYWPSGKLLFP